MMLAPQIEEAVIALENKIREYNPEIVALFVKPQTAKTFQDQRERSLGQAPPIQTPSTPPHPARRRNCLVVTNGVPCGARLPDVVAIHVGRADEAAAERPIDDLPAVEGPPNEDWWKS
jgi:hypothetical protein